MFSHSNRLATALAILVGTVVLAACNSGSASNNSMATLLQKNLEPVPGTTVAIPRGQSMFNPFLLVVQPGMTVTWQNSDTVAHAILTTQEQSSFLNPQAFSLHVAAGQKVSFTFTRTGLYDYFDNTRATWKKAEQRVAANKGVPNYPLAMEGVIWVQGPVSGLPSQMTGVIPGKDLFSPDFLAISRGGKVTWHNEDTDNHFLSLVPGWPEPINPVNLGTIQIKGTDAQPGGGTVTLSFSTPGLYYYYCSAHALVNALWDRAQALRSASETPIPMEGFLLVTNSPK